MEKLKEQKGITLIALIITIIVILILAGIGIVTLTGNNGVLKKATDAKSENEKVELEEQIKLAIMAARTATNGNGIDLEVLEKELINNIELAKEEIIKEGENGKLPWRVNHSGYSYRINEEGKLQEKSGIVLNKTRLKLLTGQTEKLEVTLDGITGNITWSTTDASVVTVENGSVVAVGNKVGESAQIIVSVEGTNDREVCNVTIVEKVTQISAENLNIEIGEKQKIVVTTTPAEHVEDLSYQFVSQDITKLTVDETSGEVEGLSSGSIRVNIFAKRQDGTSLPTIFCTITVKSKEVYVTAKEIAENPSYYYGKTIVNCVGKIFYVDKKTEEYPNGYFGDIEGNDEYSVYLQVGGKSGLDARAILSRYEYYNSETTMVRKMNPQWAKVRGNREEDWKENEKVAAYLTTPDMSYWNYDKTKVKYALGAISLEMYMKAYNEVQHPLAGQHKLETYFDESNNGYRYIVDGTVIENKQTNSYILDYRGYDRVFNPKDNGSLSQMPFSSPIFGSDERFLCAIDLSSYGLKYTYSNGNNILSYLICLRPDFEIKVRL